jgi:nucleotide-binding universal stress UspA family protein
MISKILVAVDGSECANKALDFALALAEKQSASVVILNVMQLPAYGSSDDPLAYSPSMGGIAKDIRKIHESLLSKASERAAAAKPNIHVTTELREGHPAKQIVAATSEGSFDMVVVGHGGQGRLKEMLLGGVSERVAHLAQCAVLIVK